LISTITGAYEIISSIVGGSTAISKWVLRGAVVNAAGARHRRARAKAAYSCYVASYFAEQQ
jgi:hypothetical protein